MNSNGSNYIPELDGLRAIAVISVLLFHVGFKFIAGGYLGVDIFYVISGFLITDIVERQLQTQGFSFMRFYENRANRLLPALFAILFACLPWTFLIYDTFDRQEFMDSSIAVLCYISNFYFYSKTGYFSREAILTPLLHTWSLAVEEQFYFIHPALLWVLSWATPNKKLSFSICFIFFTTSFIYSILCDIFFPEWGFFFIGSRLWELMFGCLIAKFGNSFEYNNPSFIHKSVAAYIGLVLVAISLFIFQENFISPTIARLSAVTATAFCIIAVNNYNSNKSTNNLILSNFALTYFGRISYSIYLVHQPLIAFYCKSKQLETSMKEKLFLIVATIFLSSICYQGVEQPFRRKESSVMTRRILLITAFVLLICFTSYYAMNERNILLIEKKENIDKMKLEASKLFIAIRQDAANQSRTGDLSNDRMRSSKSEMRKNLDTKDCDLNLVKKVRTGVFPFKAEDFQYFYKQVGEGIHSKFLGDSANKSKKIQIAMFGDSSSIVAAIPLEITLSQLKIRGIAIMKSGCGFVEHTKRPKFGSPTACLGTRSESIRELSKAVEHNVTVILMFNHAIQFSISDPEFINDTLASIRSLLAIGHRVVLIYPYSIPEDYSLSKTKQIYAQANPQLYDTTTPYADYFNRKGVMRLIEAFDSVGNEPRVLRVYPNKVFCGSPFPNRCNVMDCEVAYLIDNAHYSTTGASILLNEVMNVIIKAGLNF